MTLMGFWLWKERKKRENRFFGFLFGAAIGEALTTTVLPEIKTLLHGDDTSSRRIELYPLNNRVLGAWSVPTLQLLTGCQTLIVMAENSTDGRKFFDPNFLKACYLESADKLQAELPEDLKNRQQVSLNCGSGMVLSRVAPIIFLSRFCCMELHQTITLTIRMASLTCHRPKDIFPAVELVLLLKSILSQNTIPNVYDELRIFMKKSRLRYQYHFDEYEKCRLRPLSMQEQGSGLWLWKSVNKSLGLTPGKKWADIPEFLPGLLEVKKESPCPDVAGTLAGMILGFCSKYDGLPVELVKNLQHAKIVDDLGKRCLNKFVQGVMLIGKRKFKRFNKVSKSENEFEGCWKKEPFLMYQSAEELRCTFITIVVKNEALKVKYPGGIKAYARQFRARFNDKIAVTCYMGEIEDNIQALKNHGISADDYVVIDFACYQMFIGLQRDMPKSEWLFNPYDVDPGVKWLKASYAKDGFYVGYVESDAGNKSV